MAPLVTIDALVFLEIDKGLNHMFRSKRTGLRSARTSGGTMRDGSSGELVWHRPTCDGGECVEVAATGDAVLLRSSSSPDSVPVTLSRDEWREFLAGAKDGSFDHV